MIRLAESTTWGVTLSVFALVGAAVVLLYRPAVRRLTSGKRIWLVGVRMAWALLAAAVLLRPVMDDLLPPLKRVLALLVDSSRSMAVSDNVEPRFDAAKKSMQKVQRQSFGWDVRILEFAKTIESLHSEKAEGTATDLAAAIDAGRTIAAPGGAIMILSDGVETAGGDPLKAADRAAASAVPIVALHPDKPAVGERRIVAVEFDPTIEKSQRADVRVQVQGDGPFDVRLRREADILARQSVPRGAGRSQITLSHVPPDVGILDLVVEADAGASEIFGVDNACTIAQRVVNRREAVIAVLWVEPRWDARAIVTALEGVAGVDVRSVRGSAEEWRSPHGPIGLSNVDHADALILVGVAARDIGPVAQEHMVHAVENGMGLAMVGGPEGFGLGGWAGSPLAKVLPVEIRPVEPGLDVAPFVPAITAVGQHDPLTQLAASSDHPAAFPEVQKLNVLGRIKPAGVALAVHPTAHASPEPLPLLVRGRYGDGMTLAIAMADIWRWAYQSADDRKKMDVFWQRVAAYLSKVEPTRLNVELPAKWMRPHDEVQARVSVQPPGTDSKPVTWHLAGPGATDGGQSGWDGVLPPAGGIIRLRPRMDGMFALTVQAPASDAGPAEQTRMVINVSELAVEGERLDPDTVLLSAVAARTSGWSAPWTDAPAALRTLTERPSAGMRRKTRDVWDQPWVLGVFLALLTLEWTSRRWWGLP